MKVAKVGVALSGESVVAVGSTTKLTNTKKNSSRAKITYTSSDDTIAKVVLQQVLLQVLRLVRQQSQLRLQLVRIQLKLLRM